MLFKGQNTEFQQLVGLLFVNKCIEHQKILDYNIDKEHKYEINVVMHLR